MSSYKQLKQKKAEAHTATLESVKKFHELSEAANKVADVAKNADYLIDKLDQDFEKATKLSKTDIAFLFLATGLQCAKQYIFSNEKFRLTDKENEKLIKGAAKKFVPKSMEDVLLGGVPYDAIQRSNDLRAIGHSTELSGTTHRYRTLGHDPVLGWVFGPVNILSDSLTKSDIVTTYHVSGHMIDGFYRNGTTGAVSDALVQVEDNPYLLPAAIARQAIHYGSDYFTKQGLPLPLMGTLSPSAAQKLVTEFRVDMYSVTRGASLSILINTLISYIHQLFYDGGAQMNLYNIRTRKIIDYSNIIASSSNVIYVAVSHDLAKLDVGGILVTIYRLISDSRFKKKIKQEFMEQEFYKIVMENGGMYDVE